MNYSEVIEKTHAYNNIRRDMESKRFAHAFLFVSADTDYLLEFAKKVSMLIIDDKNANNKIQKEVYPDVIILGKTSKITSQDASQLTQSVYVRGYNSDKKVYILIDCDEMNEESQNKLLKTIEEPPENVYLLLLARNTNSLLQTILSRVSKVELDKIETGDIERMLVESGVSNITASEVAPCSNNNAMLALKLAEDKNFKTLYDNTLRMFEMNSSKDIIDFAKIFSQKSVDKEEWINLIMMFCRDILVYKAGKKNLVESKSAENRIAALSGSFSVTALTKIIEECLKSAESLQYNVNETCVVDELLLKFVEVKVRCRK